MTDNAPLVPDAWNKQPYEEAVVQQAFLIWTFEAHRSYAATANKLAEQMRAAAALRGDPEPKCPDRDTIRHWAITRDWPAEAHASLADNDRFQAIFFQQRAQAVLLYGEVLTKMADAVVNMEAKPENLAALAKIAEHLAKTGGHAVLATGMQAPALPPPPQIRESAVDLAALAPDERTRMRQKIASQQQERTRRLHQPRKGKI